MISTTGLCRWCTIGATVDFENIYIAYWNKVFRLCNGYMNDYDRAKDLCQEVFLKVWQHQGSFRGEAGVGTWIFRIATNTCLRQLEKDNRDKRMPLALPEPETDNREEEAHLQLLHRLITELPEMDRIIILLELEDMKQAQIAQVVGLSESNVRVRLHRIKERLTKKFKEHGAC